MPLWNVYHPPSAFATAEEKAAFVKDINDYYCVKGTLPPIYVVVNFITLPSTHIYRAGRPISELDTPFIRLAISHLAVHTQDWKDPTVGELDEETAYAKVRAGIDGAIQKSIRDKGYYYEYSVSEESRGMWKIDGFVPPPWRSEGERKWATEGKAVPY